MLAISSASENVEQLHLLQVTGRNENDTVTLEKSLGVFLKTKHTTTI